MLYIVDKEKNEFKYAIDTNNPEKWKNDETLLVLEGVAGLVYNPETYSLQEPEVIENLIIERDPLPNFDGFMNAMEDTEIWMELVITSSKNLRLNTAFTVLVAALTASKSVKGVGTGLYLLREAMKDSKQTSDFDDESIDLINRNFKEFYIPIILEYSEPDVEVEVKAKLDE